MVQVRKLFKKKLVCAFVMVSVVMIQLLVSGGVQVYAQSQPFTHYFPDRAFAEAVASRMGRNVTSNVTEQELRGITGTLNASNRGIQNIEGAQFLRGLTTLNLNNNQIMSLERIGAEVGPQIVHAENQIITLPPLVNERIVSVNIRDRWGRVPQNTIDRPGEISGSGSFNWQTETIIWNKLGQNNMIWNMRSDFGTFSGTLIQHVVDESRPVTRDGLDYSINTSTLEAKVTGYTGSNKNIRILSTLEIYGLKYAVTHIESHVFSNSQLTSVQLPESLTHIGNNAFANNQLTHIEFPESLTHIGSNAFANNQLISVQFPKSLKTIDGSAFSNNQLTSVEFLSTGTNVQSVVFGQNPLEFITVPEGGAETMAPMLQNAILGVRTNTILRENINNVYQWNPYLNIWEDFTEEGNDKEPEDEMTEGLQFSFDHNNWEATVTRYTGSSSEVVIPRTVVHHGLTYRVTAIGNSVFMDRPIKHVKIPNTILNIGNYAFYDTELIDVEIPNSVQSIGNYAFYNTSTLRSLDVSDSITSVGVGAFGNTPLQYINVSKGTAEGMAPLLRDGMVSVSNTIPGVTTNTILREGTTSKFQWNGNDDWNPIN